MTHEQTKRFLRRVKGRKAQGTYNTRKSDLKNFEGWLTDEGIDLLEVEPLDIDSYLIHLSNKGYAPPTISSRYDSVRLLYKRLEGLFGVLEESPFEHIKRKEYKEMMAGTKKGEATREDITYLTSDEVDNVAASVPNPKLRNELLVRLMFQTGLREGEMVEIRLIDIDRESRSIKIHAEKTHSNRTVYYQPSLDILLDQWIDGGYRLSYSHAANSPYLFVTRKSEQLQNERVNKIVKCAGENAGFNQEPMYTDMAGKDRWMVTSHTLRHSHAIEAVRSGIDIERLRDHMGHSSLDVTKKYLQFGQDDVREAFESFGTR